MSIFDDKNLIKDLISAGSEFNKKFAAPPSSATTSAQISPEQQTIQFAHALGVNLQRSLGDTEAPPIEQPFGTESGNDADAFMANSASLGHFLQWAARNKLTYNGKRFVWEKDGKDVNGTYQQGPDEQLALAEKSPAPLLFEGIDTDTNHKVNGQYSKIYCYANKNALIAYLNYLRDAVVPKTSDPKALEVVVKRLILQLNTQLPVNQRLSEVARAEVSSDIDLNSVVDAFPSGILKPNQNGIYNDGLDRAPMFEGLPVPLTMAHLKDYTSLSNWLMNMQMQRPTDQNPVKVIDLTNPDNSDPCVALRVLYNRARTLNAYSGGLEQRGKANYSKMAARYLQAITMFAPNFQNKDGPCNVTSATVAPGTGTGTGQPGQPGQPGTGADGLTPEQKGILNEILSTYLPLDMTYIDVERINAFSNKLQELVRGNTTQAMVNISVRIEREVNVLKTQLGSVNAYSNNSRIPLTGNITNMLGNIRNRDDIHYFLDALTAVVSTTRNLLSMLSSSFESIMLPDQKQKLNDQINRVAYRNTSLLHGFIDVVVRGTR